MKEDDVAKVIHQKTYCQSQLLPHLMHFLYPFPPGALLLPPCCSNCANTVFPLSMLYDGLLLLFLSDGSYDDLLKDDNVQCVYVGNLHVFRREIGEKCLQAGKHVLLEKPFAISTEDAAYLIQLAKKKNLLIMEVRRKELEIYVCRCVCGRAVFLKIFSSFSD